MKLVATAKLLPDDAQRTALLATMERFNTACDWLAGEAFAAGCADKIALQKTHYRALRDRFSLSAQMAVRAISKVCEAYKRDKKKRPRFKPHGSVPYDPRILTFKALDRVSLLTLGGRILLPYVAGDYHRARLEGVRGQSDLVLRKGRWYLYVTVEVPESTPIQPVGWLGVDLGIRNLATDSDGTRHTGDAVERVRTRHHALKQALQATGTKSAKRHLKKLSGHEARFRADTNHVVSKKLVGTAQDTRRGIALEDLHGIRDRVTVRHDQRAQHGGWAFHQLRAFIAYKAQRAGVPVEVVDPRNTSRTCPTCGCCDRKNRPSQAVFRCLGCGNTGHADHIAARNIAHRAAVNRPIVSNVEGGNAETAHRGPRLSSGTSSAL